MTREVLPGQSRYRRLQRACKEHGLPAVGTSAALAERLRRRGAQRPPLQCSSDAAAAVTTMAAAASATSPAHPTTNAAVSTVLPQRYSRRLFLSSSLTLFSVVGAALAERWGCCAFATAVLLCSWNYWRDATRGWRRNVDMIFAFAGIAWHGGVALQALSTHPRAVAGYAALTGAAMGCYFCARASDDDNVSSSWHAAMHAVGNLANTFLYWGLP